MQEATEMDQPLTLITSISPKIPISKIILALSNIPVGEEGRKHRRQVISVLGVIANRAGIEVQLAW